MSTCKISLREDCDHSPKNEFAQQLTVAFVAGNGERVAEEVTSYIILTS